MPSAARTGGAGYSGTPLARKLGIKPGHRVAVSGRPSGWEIPDPPPEVELVDTEPADDVHASVVASADVVLAFSRERAELEPAVPVIAGHLAPAAAVWIAWPRRAGGHTSDITENLLRELLLPTGLVDVKVAALDADWSGLRFVWRKERRPTAR